VNLQHWTRSIVPGGAAEVASMLAKVRERDSKATLFSEVFVNLLAMNMSRWAIPRVQWGS